jgi:hypothetical protein
MPFTEDGVMLLRLALQGATSRLEESVIYSKGGRVQSLFSNVRTSI